MRFGANDQADASQVEDRRGFNFPGGRWGAGAGGLGLIGTLIVLAFQVLGGGGTTSNDPQNTLPPGVANRSPSAPGGENPALGGSCEGASSTGDQAKFIACVETNIQAFWRGKLSHYVPAKLVLFTDRTPSGCGTASAATGPFYCPDDSKVYLDLGFFNELHARFGARGGDFAEAYVVAHEYGHHVQDLVGTEKKYRALVEQQPRQANALSVRVELQADCFAGVWGHSAYGSGKVNAAEVADALDAAAAIGDDRIQEAVSGRVRPEKFTHGSSEDRQRWFNTGMKSGDPAACDTFGQDL